MQVRLLEVLGQVGHDSGFNITHLFVYLAGEIIEIVFKLCEIWYCTTVSLQCTWWFQRPKAIALVVLDIAAEAASMHAFDDTFKFADALTDVCRFRVRTLLRATTLRERSFRPSRADTARMVHA